MAVLTWLGVPAVTGLWSRLGFHADAESVRIGDVMVQRGVAPMAWGFDELLADPAPLRVPTSLVRPPDGQAPAQPNGVERVDHVVYNVRDLDQAVASIGQVLGLQPRLRSRPYGDSGPEMAFFRSGRAVLEISDGAPIPSLWGLALRSRGLDLTVEAIRAAGGDVSDPRSAVQGGRIATVRDAGVALAILEPPGPQKGATRPPGGWGPGHDPGWGGASGETRNGYPPFRPPKPDDFQNLCSDPGRGTLTACPS